MADREMILDHLQKAEHHVVTGAQHVRAQREIVAELERDGHDAEEARKLLRSFEELQAAHIADRDRLRKELAQAERRSS